MIEKYHGKDRMIDVISDDYRMLQVISRFGITLGFGDQTVAATCKNAGVDLETFLTVVNFLRDPHVSINKLVERVNLKALIMYLKNSHIYFVDYKLPAVRRKLIEAIDCSARNQIAFLILKFYDEYAEDVSRHMEYENKYVHPHVENLLHGKLTLESFNTVVNQHSRNHASIEKSISELKNIIIKYYPSDANAQLLNDVLMDIYMVEEDLLTHCHLEDTLFAECVRKLEKDVRNHGGKVIVETVKSNDSQNNNANELSDREKEVIALVAMGLSNKEIAEKMFIAVNTVMTHRRNITRKLEIHSPAGLTIYAIVNGLIKLEDVKL